MRFCPPHSRVNARLHWHFAISSPVPCSAGLVLGVWQETVAARTWPIGKPQLPKNIQTEIKGLRAAEGLLLKVLPPQQEAGAGVTCVPLPGASCEAERHFARWSVIQWILTHHSKRSLHAIPFSPLKILPNCCDRMRQSKKVQPKKKKKSSLDVSRVNLLKLKYFLDLWHL